MTQNYIFDLYGTLIDIRTDEASPSLWKKMAELYAVYGATYTAKELEAGYRRSVTRKETELRQSSGFTFPEIDLTEVFWELLTDEAHRDYAVPLPEQESWVFQTMNTFRILSRKKFRLFPDTIPTLEALKSSGKQLYLLSNAQAVFTRPELRALGLTAYFEDLFLSSEHGIRKPQPEFLRKLMEKHHLKPEETVMIGNEEESDLAIAKACEIPGILVSERRFEDKSTLLTQDNKMDRILQDSELLKKAR